MHDDQQIVRLHQLDKALLDGQFPVRWVPDLGFGFGYPLFNFYPPLTYYLGEIFHLSGLSLIDSTKIVWLLGFAGSGLAMFILSRTFFGNLGGIISSLFYLYAPYHGVDAYVRGAQAELFSFVWLPLILLAGYKGNIMWAGILLGLLMLTHNLIFLPFAGLYLLWSLIWGKEKFLGSIVSMGLAFFLTAFFWLPAILEKSLTLVDQLLIKNLASYTIHFVCPNQLFSTFWGYGGSNSGCVDGMSFSVGRLHLFMVLLITIVSFFKPKKVILASLGIFYFSVFMMTPFSKFVWDLIFPLWYLQFPWRFLEFSALFSSLAIGGAVVFVSNRNLKIILAVVLCSILVWRSVKYFQPQTYIYDATDQKLTTDNKIKWEISGSSFEYLPIGVATKMTDKGVLWVEIDEQTIKKEDFKVSNGKILKQDFKAHSFSLEGDFQDRAEIQVGITNFPGWQVFVDGKEAVILDNNKYKLITVSVPEGYHLVTGKYVGTPLQRVGNTITIGSIIAMILYGYKRSKKKSR